MLNLVFGLSAALVGQAVADCSRATLQQGVDKYLATVTGGTAKTTLAEGIDYSENFASKDYKTGLHSSPIKVAYNRSLLDTTSCATYTEIIAPDNNPPYVLGTQIRYTDGKPKKVEVVLTTAGDRFFNASSTLKWVTQEDRSVIPEGKRDTREVIQAVADVYLDSFDVAKPIPKVTPCERVEGGVHVAPDCTRGITSNGGKMLNKRYVIDETVGTVDVFVSFRTTMPDSHEFRVEGGKLKYVHAITAAKTMGPKRRTVV